uniref:NADP-dependent oxidoreductase domain-containing protein n=1 Tax=Bos indicus x Bos taurus TaxID=30522 RepID=A0A4W2CM65_BOBOX
MYKHTFVYFSLGVGISSLHLFCHINNTIPYNLTLFSVDILQVECHPYLNQRKLLDFCKSHDIVLVAYAALGSQRLKEWVNLDLPVLLEDQVLCTIAKKHKQTPALVALRYQIQRGVVVLAKSYNKKRIKENIQVFELTPEDMKAIDGINRNIRYYEFLLKTVLIPA